MSGAAPTALLFAIGGASASPAQEPPRVDDPPVAATPVAETTALDALHGSWSLQYRGRRSGGESDQDLFSVLGLDWGEASRDRFSAHLLTRAAADLDGDRDRDGSYAFDSLADTYERPLTAQLYQAWVGGRLAGAIERWAAGRFPLDDTPVVTTIDGGRLSSARAGAVQAELGAYGGVPVHFFESSPSGDWIAGGYGMARPWTGARSRVDAMHVEDEVQFADHQDDLIGLSQWQQFGPTLAAFGRFTWLEGEARDLQLRGRFDDPAVGRASLTWYELFDGQSALSREFDPFYESAFQYQPYRQLACAVGREFGRHLDVSAGFDVRRLRDRSDDAAFNHEFERWFVAPMVIGVPNEAVTLGFAGELWTAESERYATLSGDATIECSESTRLRGGTSYSRYRYDLYQDRELDRVRTWFVGLDRKLAERLRLRLDYEFERDSYDRYHTLRMRMTWAF